MSLANVLSRAERELNREETMAEQRVEMHISIMIRADDDMYKDGML